MPKSRGIDFALHSTLINAFFILVPIVFIVVQVGFAVVSETQFSGYWQESQTLLNYIVGVGAAGGQLDTATVVKGMSSLASGGDQALTLYRRCTVVGVVFGTIEILVSLSCFWHNSNC